MTVRSGETVKAFLTIGETPNGPIRIPLVIINGAADGPVLCLTAGVHATEYASISAAMRLVNELTPGELRGAVIVVPVVSMAMFQSRLPFISPIDGLNLNKIAPGGAGGSISEILAHALLTEVIAKAQYHIDLHAGDFGEMLLPFAGFPLTGNADFDRQGEALARLFTPRLISIGPESGPLSLPFAGGIVRAATRLGVISILGESDGNGALEDADVRVHYDGVRNVMRYLDMIDGEPVIVGTRLKATDRFVIRATKSGLVRLKVKIGDTVSAGQDLAEICNVFGETVEVIRAPRAGIPGLIWSHKVVNTGDPVLRCWAAEAAPPFPETDKFMRDAA
ncbi:MAG: succinylglutamate desuccinylase/aspartoacylase family protein [Casimicrobiaceae bacterium]